MSDSSSVAPLRVANEAFLVASMIERCPKTMMLRELVMNGLEAAALAEPGRGLVAIEPRLHDGVRKLRIWNTGAGMSAAELLQITDLASSLRKQNSLEENFGMGAKVAALPSNRHGLRYRSCTDGRVSEVVMGQRAGVYGRLQVGPAQEQVLDVTAACVAEGDYDLSFDWTEVLLLGNDAGQDTVVAPYGTTFKVEPDWVAAYLEDRFFRYPANVAVTLDPGGRIMVGLGERRGAFGRTETRETPSGVKIHYYYDPPVGKSTQSAKAGLATASSRGAIVFRDEMYDLRIKEAWLQDAPNFGVPFGAKYVSVFVELPPDYLVLPEAYRQFLRFRGNDQRQVHLSDFGPLVRSNMPAWLAEIIRSFGPGQANYMDDINQELADLLAMLGVKPRAQAPVPGAVPKRPESMASTKSVETKAARVPQTPPTPPKPKPPVFERSPEVISLRTPEQLEERALEDRAAKFYPQSHQIFINLSYPAVTQMADTLVAEIEAAPGAMDEAIRRIATEVSEWSLTKRIARAVIFSLSKKALGWRMEDVSRGQSPESLSLVADDWLGSMDIARARFEDRLGAELPAVLTPRAEAA